ncbi:MAG TPA: AtpZ/AtpI family protein [Phenylobacterium sp.]
MPQPDDSRKQARDRLDERLDAAEAAQAQKASGEAHLAMARGYRFLGEVVGGVLGGAGFGWLIDRFAGTAPWGLIGGLLIGTGLALTVAIKGAAQMTKAAMERAGPLPSVPPDEDED